MCDNPSYFAIIPANVRYSKEITANAKLIYGEITALANKDGYCFASNDYFAQLYDVDNCTISRWIQSLAKAGFVRIELFRDEKKQIIGRHIYINLEEPRLQKDQHPIDDFARGYIQKDQYPIDEKVKDNNTSINNTNSNNINLKECDLPETKKRTRKMFIPPTYEECQKYAAEKKLNLDVFYFYDYYTKANWIDASNHHVKNWKNKMITWSMKNQTNSSGNKNRQVFTPSMNFEGDRILL